MSDFTLNGIFKFFINHNKKIEDDRINVHFSTGINNYYYLYNIFIILLVFFDLAPGNHDFLWQYTKYYDNNTPNTKTVKIEIEKIIIEGVEFSDYECQSCNGMSSPVGSSECYFCKLNQYYDNSQVTYN